MYYKASWVFFRGVWETFCESVMEDLAQSWTRLSLTEREGPGCRLTPDESVKQFSIAARFTTRRAINVDSIARTFTPLWRAKNGFKIQKIGDHEMLFSFDTKEEVDRILNSEPWSFDKHLVVMQRYDHESSLEDVSFERTNFWVQVHGLPIKFMTIAAAEKICGVVGEVISQTESKLYDGGNFIRVKVAVNINLPLCRGRLVTLNDEKQVWISFKYERLPNLCYWCGRLTHDDRDCELWIESEGSLKSEQREFGPSLRAQPFVASTRHTVSVPGYYSSMKKTIHGKAGGQKEKERPAQPHHPEPTTRAEVSPQDDRYKDKINSHLPCNGYGVSSPINARIPPIKHVYNSEFKDLPEASNKAEKSTTAATVSNPINAKNPPITPDCNSVINDLPEASKSVEKSTKAATVQSMREYVGDMPGKEKYPNMGAINPDMVQSMGNDEGKVPGKERQPFVGINCGNFFEETNGQNRCEPARVTPTRISDQPKRILPVWTRRDRPATKGPSKPTEKITGKKRQYVSTDDHVELFSKRLQISQNGEEASSILAEADVQPRQEQ